MGRPAPTQVVEAVDFNEFTVPQLKTKLAGLGVEFDPQARKADLVALLEAQGDTK